MSPSQTRLSKYFFRSSRRVAREATESANHKEFDRVVRKTQEAVELLFKSKLLQKGIEPAKTHDLVDLADHLDLGTKVSEEDLVFLTQERIPAFYGAVDFIPDETYGQQDADRCLGILNALELL